MKGWKKVHQENTKENKDVVILTLDKLDFKAGSLFKKKVYKIQKNSIHKEDTAIKKYVAILNLCASDYIAL